MTPKYLADVNVWLALADRAHVHHAKTLNWYGGHYLDGIAYCRQSQHGFLRLITNPTVMKANCFTLSQAWGIYDGMICNPGVTYLDEPAGLDAQWRLYAQHATYSRNVWTDAYLAAFAKVMNIEFVTLDSGFRQYSGLSLTLL